MLCLNFKVFGFGFDKRVFWFFCFVDWERRKAFFILLHEKIGKSLQLNFNFILFFSFIFVFFIYMLFATMFCQVEVSGWDGWGFSLLSPLTWVWDLRAPSFILCFFLLSIYALFLLMYLSTTLFDIWESWLSWLRH